MTQTHSWRNLLRGDRHLLAREVTHQMDKRFHDGLIRYGPEFRGNPLDDLREELVDAQAYTEVVGRYIRYLEGLLLKHNIPFEGKEDVQIDES